MKIELSSACNVKGCEGIPGDTVIIKDAALAKRIIDGHGGVEVTDDKKTDDKK